MPALSATLWDTVPEKSDFQSSGSTPPRVLKLERSAFFILINMPHSTNVSVKVLNFGLKVFYAWFSDKIFQKILKFRELRKKSRRNLKFWYWRLYIEENMLIRIKIPISLTSNLGGDCFGNFLTQSPPFYIIFKKMLLKSKLIKKIIHIK